MHEVKGKWQFPNFYFHPMSWEKGREKKITFFNAAFKIEKQKKKNLQHLIGLPCNLKTDFQKLIYSNLQSLFEGTSEGAPCNLCVANSFESCP